MTINYKNMFSLKATIRDKKIKPGVLRKQAVLPVILYGEGIENQMLKVAEKDFLAAFKSAGESSLLSLEVGSKKYEVLIHQITRDPLSSKFLHIDFYHPSSKKKVVAEIPLVFEGEAPAVKEFGGILVKEAHSIEVKGLAFNLPREITVDLSKLVALEDRILVKDLAMSDKLEYQKQPNEIIALVVLPKEEKPEPVPAAIENIEKEDKGGENKGDKGNRGDKGTENQ